VPKRITTILEKHIEEVIVKRLPSTLSAAEATELLECVDSHGVSAIAQTADLTRSLAPCGDKVTFTINRNINFTNACVKKCGFCAFSRTGIDAEAYFFPVEEVVRRATEAVSFDASELCIQAGLPPNMDPDLYVNLVKAVREAVPDVHLHAFSPEEVKYGARVNKIPVRDMLLRLKDAGVNTLPGTSAEILDDEVRTVIAKSRLTTQEWCEIVSTAHSVGLPTSSTIMYGHVESPHHVAHHIDLLRSMQTKSMAEYGLGFTEFVPLSFVASEAPMWKHRYINIWCNKRATVAYT
jgi:FO synthase subunit 2